MTWRPRGGTTSPQIGDLVDRAERVLRRRQQRLTFATVEQALGWYWLYRDRMQGAQAPVLRDDRDVEGGPGGDIDEVLATISTIGTALDHLRRMSPRQHAIVEFATRDGLSQREIAKRTGLSQAQVSVEYGRADAYLRGWLVHAEVIG